MTNKPQSQERSTPDLLNGLDQLEHQRIQLRKELKKPFYLRTKTKKAVNYSLHKVEKEIGFYKAAINGKSIRRVSTNNSSSLDQRIYETDEQRQQRLTSLWTRLTKLSRVLKFS